MDVALSLWCELPSSVWPPQNAEYVVPSPEELAAILRQIDFALEQSTVAMIAFIRPFTDRVNWDCERNEHSRKLIAQLLAKLPPEPPLTPEQEARAAEYVRKAIAQIDGFGAAC